MNESRFNLIAALVLILGLLFLFNFYHDQVVECEKKGGTLLRSTVGYKCVQLKVL